MTTELEMAQMLDEFIDDLNEGVMPRVYELMASGLDIPEDLIPLLDLAAQFKVSTVQMPSSEKERVKTQVLKAAQVNSTTQEWSMSRLVKESDPQVVAKGTSLGFEPTQINAVSSDMTPLDLENPSEVVNQLAEKYKMHFFDLLSWVNQLISSVLRADPHSSMSVMYARDGEGTEACKSE
jgi:hypothetical protein